MNPRTSIPHTSTRLPSVAGGHDGDLSPVACTTHTRIRLASLFLALLLCGCEPPMGQQAKYDAYAPSDFFSDGAAMRPIPNHTIARGQLSAGDTYHTGLHGDQLTAEFPEPVTPALLAHGREQFEIFCSVCHGFTGAGDGMIVQRGFPPPPTFHSERLRQAPVGHFVDVINRGYGVMFPYGSRVAAPERWAITAYIRALQLSQHATLAEVPAAERSQLQATAPGCPRHPHGRSRPMKPFLEAWLIAWLFWAGLAFGSLACRLLQGLTGGAWAQAVRAPCEAAALTLPLLALLFLPIACWGDALYPWGDPAFFTGHHWPHKAAYLSLPFFNIRTALTLGISILFAVLVLRSGRREQTICSSGLIAFFLCMNFSATDWVISLTPEFSSSIFSTILMFSHFIAALAFVVLVTCRMRAAQLTTKQCQDLGNLLLAFVIFWAYVSFSQLLLVWTGNLPREISWYLPRWSGGWQWVALLLIISQFALPLALLLSKSAKSHPRSLAVIAAILLASSLLEMFWLVAPALHPHDFVVPWRVPLACIILGCFWLPAFRWLLPRVPAWRTPMRKEAAHV